MKKKVVIQVNSTKCRKCRSEAIQIALAASDMESVCSKDDNSKIEVTGEVDLVELVVLLRKKVGLLGFLSVGPAGGEKKKDNYNNGSGGGDDGNNGSGGGKINKKGSDHDVNGDKYKNGGGETKGKNMDFMGKAGFSYGYGYWYHAGSENEYPVGQLQCAQEVRSSEPKYLFHHAVMIS